MSIGTRMSIDPKVTAFKNAVDDLEKSFYGALDYVRQDSNYPRDSGLCEGQLRAIKLVRNLIKEIFDE